MIRGKILSTIFLTGALALLGSRADAEQIRIVPGNGASPPHPFYQAGQMWKEEVEQHSNGRVQVQYLHSRQLGEDRQLIEASCQAPSTPRSARRSA